MAVATKKTTTKFRVGDWVSFHYGTGRVLVEIIEDRGPLAGNGRRLYRAALDREATESMFPEVSEDDLSLAPSKSALQDYLKKGGLVRMLKLNVPDGRNHSPVWLTSRPNGRIAHTFNDSGHDLGRAVVPFNAVFDGKVLTRKKHAVTAFLINFGLTWSQAEDVVGAVGTAP